MALLIDELLVAIVIISISFIVCKRFSETRYSMAQRNLAMLTKLSEIRWCPRSSPGGVQQWSKSGPSQDASESGNGQNIRISLCFSKREPVST